MAKGQASEAKLGKTKSPVKVDVSKKVPKKKANKSKKSNTSKKKSSKKKVARKKIASKKTVPEKKVLKSELKSSDLGIPINVQGTPMLEILATAPKIAGVITQPRHRERENDWVVAVEVEDASRKLVQSIMSFPTGQHVVAIYIPIENATDAVEWFVLNEGMDLMQAPKQPDWEKREVSGKFLAWLFDVSDRRIQQINKEGHLHKIARGRYDFHKSVQLYFKHLKDEAAGKGGTQLVDRKLKGLDLDNQNKEVDLKKKTEELVDAHGARKAGIELGLKVNDSLVRWDGLYGTRLAKAKTKLSVVSILTEARLRLQGELTKEGNGNGSGS